MAQPDTDVSAAIYEIRADGSSIALSTNLVRARYREGQRHPKLISTTVPLRYDFEHCSFTSPKVEQGSRLRLLIGPNNSIYKDRNFNSGAELARNRCGTHAAST